MTDQETLAVYAAKAEDYAKLVTTDAPAPSLLQFLRGLPDGGAVLDWGCGSGTAAGHMMAMGFAVTATDASPEFAALVTRKHGLPVRVEPFEALGEQAAFDGIWASFSLLHARKAEFPSHLARAKRALKPGGQLYLGMKLGEGEARDSIGRFYAYYSEAELRAHLTDAGFTVTDTRHGSEPGLDGVTWPYILVYAHG